MKRNIRVFITVVATSFMTIQLVAQGSDFIRISGNIATVINSHKDNRLALGALIAWLTRDNFISGK